MVKTSVTVGGLYMASLGCILFDCMETIVDVKIKPDIRLSCKWTYYDSEYESLWDSFDSFVESYETAKNYLDGKHRKYEEYSLFDRFMFMVRQVDTKGHETETIVNALSNNYWKNYKRNCFVHDSVKSTLLELSGKFRLGIVSNFMVNGGVEELLEIHGISKYFDFIITSIKVGWKKPSEKIYAAALDAAKVPKEQVLFVGDDYICDYEAPLKYGFDAILLDKENKFIDVKKRITAIKDLVHMIS